MCCRGFISAIFKSNAADKIDSEHTRDYKRLLTVCEAEILRVTVKRIEVFSSFLLSSDDFRLKVPKIAKRVPRFLTDVHKDGYTSYKYINTVLKMVY